MTKPRTLPDNGFKSRNKTVGAASALAKHQEWDDIALIDRELAELESALECVSDYDDNTDTEYDIINNKLRGIV